MNPHDLAIAVDRLEARVAALEKAFGAQVRPENPVPQTETGGSVAPPTPEAGTGS